MPDLTPAQVQALLDAATLGPWETDADRPRWIRTAAPIQIDEADWGTEGHTQYRLGTNADNRAWRYADVLLIAAAPDLARLVLDQAAALDRVRELAEQWERSVRIYRESGSGPLVFSATECAEVLTEAVAGPATSGDQAE